ncbi:Xyloglucan-specific endo-beta-1 [Phytophthora citrophthora]|uniref:Xyloglucan-specific endo-beta-1 n=1 Tax=Phytophthora citrophthora TaxID=4793 RepID=A0AAD9GB38_9STRA|nr:Xyloglucan-specific endo-beta-1 [Phytophthora citrophthora]
MTAAVVTSTYADVFCDQWGTATTDDYIIYNNLWGESYATSGSQCTGLDSSSGSTVAWHTNWTWTGASSNVKSYANAALQFDAVQLSSVSSIPSTLEYSLDYSGTVVADVSYDLFTSSTSDGDNEFEIMIWLAAIGGAGPISSTGSAVATTTIAGTTWSLYSGANGDTTVYSFVASDTVKSFSGDLMDFFTYLIENESFSTAQYLNTVQAGTEPFTGTDVTLTVSSYSAVVNTGTSSGTTTTSSTTGSSTTSTSTKELVASSSSIETDTETTAPIASSANSYNQEETTALSTSTTSTASSVGGEATTIVASSLSGEGTTSTTSSQSVTSSTWNEQESNAASAASTTSSGATSTTTTTSTTSSSWATSPSTTDASTTAETTTPSTSTATTAPSTSTTSGQKCANRRVRPSSDNLTSMKVFFAAALTAAAVSAVSAADFCDQWGQAKSGNYIIYNNLWGSSAATGGGKQCTGLDSGSGDTVSWHTKWSWQGGDKSVKSFANAALEFDPVPLTEVKSIPSTMSYTVKYSGNVVADVAYDLFTSSTAKGEKEFEIMIWLAAIGGAGPISSTGKAIDTTTIAGTEWSVYKGPNGQMMVYSFVASKQVENFEGDLMEFFNYLTKSQSFKTSQYLIKVECGTEPFVGTDVSMTVSKYSATVNTGKGGSTTPAQSGDSSSTGAQTTTAPSTSNTGSSSEQTTTAPSTGSSSEQTPATSSTGSSSEQTPATSSTGSSTEETPSTSSTGSSEQTPATSSTGSSTEETPSSGSSEQTPATSSTGSSAETPSSDAGSSEQTPSTGSSAQTPTTSSTGSSTEETPASSSGGETTTSGSDESTTQGSGDASTPTTSSSSEETPSTGSSTDQQETTTAPTTSSSSEEAPSTGTNPKCTLRRARRD